MERTLGFGRGNLARTFNRRRLLASLEWGFSRNFSPTFSKKW